jgi:hypothetical protein
VLTAGLVLAIAATGLIVWPDRSDRPAVVPTPTTASPTPDIPRVDITGHPPANRWIVEVAWVNSDLDEITIRSEAPDSVRVADPDRPKSSAHPDSVTLAEVPAPDLASQEATAAALPLTPIPSPGLSWGSTAVGDTWVFENPTVIGSPLAFLVVEDAGDWLRVQFPSRPNHQTGWISADDVHIERHDWHAEVNITTNRLRVWKGDEVMVDTAVVAGTQYTATPLGRFYINEKQRTDSWSAYGSWILSTNGFSDVLERFSGDVPIFALHGTSAPWTVGQDLSNGCIRMPNEHVELLAEQMPIGTPVDIVA